MHQDKIIINNTEYPLYYDYLEEIGDLVKHYHYYDDYDNLTILTIDEVLALRD